MKEIEVVLELIAELEKVEDKKIPVLVDGPHYYSDFGMIVSLDLGLHDEADHSLDINAVDIDLETDFEDPPLFLTSSIHTHSVESFLLELSKVKNKKSKLYIYLHSDSERYPVISVSHLHTNPLLDVEQYISIRCHE